MNVNKPLTPAQIERISYLAEECAEVAQTCMKILRHGWVAMDHSVAPTVEYANHIELANELRNVRMAYERLFRAGEIMGDPFAPVKGPFNQRYFHHQDKDA